MSATFHLPFCGDLHVDCVATDAFRGRTLQFERYRGECFFRAFFIHGIYTPNNWKPHHGDSHEDLH